MSRLKNERGFALVVSLFVMAVLTLIDLGAVQITTIDSMIIGNCNDSVQAFYIAEAGIEREKDVLKSVSYPEDVLKGKEVLRMMES
tara:strand:+ start:25 stop:282 length:258 start_codon:yes stop_codon:yes gene_type:complete